MMLQGWPGLVSSTVSDQAAKKLGGQNHIRNAHTHIHVISRAPAREHSVSPPMCIVGLRFGLSGS